MKNKEFLSDAMEHIGDDLILDAKDFPKPSLLRRRLPTILTAAAACAALVVGCFLMFPGKEPSAIIGNPPSTTPPLPTIPPIVDVRNLWEQEDFSAYSLLYADYTQPQGLSYSDGSQVLLLNESTAEQTTLQTIPLTLSGITSVKIESFIGDRYVAYLSDTGNAIFYDTQTDSIVNLHERILGDTAADPEAFLAIAESVAREKFPGIFDSPVNLEFFRAYARSMMDKTPSPLVNDWDVDISFMENLREYKYTAIEDRPRYFKYMCGEAYSLSFSHEDYIQLQPYRVQFLSIDPQSGKCVVAIRDLSGKWLSRKIYDITTDEFIDETTVSTWLHGNKVHYNANGKLLTVAYNYSVSSGHLDPDFTLLENNYPKKIQVGKYQGETIALINCETGWQGIVGEQAASEGFLSESGKVCYYKKLPTECYNKRFYISGKNWHNRLTLFNQDTDQWVFCYPSGTDPYGIKTTLQGNFVRFMANENVVVMERGGVYFAFLLDGSPNGQDITQFIKDGRLSVAEHERVRVFTEDGVLYKQDLFSGAEKQSIVPADQYVLCHNGAFAFVYKTGAEQVLCYNIATLEYCAIDLDPQLLLLLQAMPNAVFRMTYNESQNSLTLSFYPEGEAEESVKVNFLEMISQIKDEATYTVNTQFSLSDELVEEFRQSMQKLFDPDYANGYLSEIYPESLPMYLDRQGLNEALGFEITDDMLDINGTDFILYEDEDESIVLRFEPYWGLYDYTHHYSGFLIIYTQDEYLYPYEFVHPSVKDY